VKPNNLLVTQRDGRDVVKLADFGLARIYHSSVLSQLTLEGDIRGTFGFLAPEHVRDLRNVGPEADQYGAGATLYYLLTGQLIYDFPDDDGSECLRIILQEDPRPIRELRPDVPDGLAEVVHKSLAREPSDRFPDAITMREALAPWAGAMD
jgi:serine/threonine-protein kinase